MIKIYSNSKGSGDWIQVFDGEKEVWEGHSISVRDLHYILLELNKEVKRIDLTDEEMEAVQ